MINGIRKEIVIKEFVVSGQAAIPRPFHVTAMVVDLLIVKWQRTESTPWRAEWISARGRQARKDGTAGKSRADTDWYRRDHSDGWGPEEPPAWVASVALTDLPTGGVLPPVAAETADLDH